MFEISEVCNKFSKSVSYETLVGGTATISRGIKQTQRLSKGSADKPLTAVGTLTSLPCNSAKVMEKLFYRLRLRMTIPTLALLFTLATIAESSAETICVWDTINPTKLVISGSGEASSSSCPENWRDTATELEFKEGITSIKEGNFSSAHALENVSIPNSVTKIGNYAFAHDAIKSINLPNSITEIEYAAFADNQISKIILPDSLIKIGWGAFNGNNLSEIVISDTVSSLANDITFGSDLEQLKKMSIICRGTEESCENIKTLLGSYGYHDGDGWGFTNILPSLISLAEERNCNSANYYWTGVECVREPDVTKRTCEYAITGYIKVGDYCASPEVTYAKKHYTPAEANQWLKDDDNFVVLTFKK